MDSTQERLQALFDYRDGELIWKENKEGGRKNSFVGKSAGAATRDGRVYIRVDNNLQRRSRLVWIYHNGLIQKGLVIDHRDRDHSNDKIDNLRPCTQKQNTQNRTTECNSNTGIKGVSFRERDKAFYVSVNGKYHSFHKTLEAAVKARAKAAIEAYGEFANE